MKKINVMHIRDSGGIFGGERVILTLCKNLNSRLFNVKLLCMRRENGISEKLISRAKALGIAVEVVSVKGRFNVEAVLKVRKAFKENNVSLFHSHDFKSNFYGLLASTNLGIKRVATAHGSTRDSLLKRLYLLWDEKVTYRFFDRIITVSEDMRTHLKQRNLSQERLTVIRNGLDFELLDNEIKESNSETPLPIPGGHVVFGVIARLYPDKGHRFFLQAFSKVCRNYPKITGLIVGDGPTRDAIAGQIRELGLQGSVFLCGVRSDMRNVYDSLDFLVIPSLTEGLPYVLLEALHTRVPVLATAVGDIPLLINDGVSGYLVPPGDANALEKRMTELLNYPEKAKQMAEKGHRLVVEEYSGAKMVMETEKLYMSLLN